MNIPRKSVFIISGLIVSVFILSQCLHEVKLPEDPRGKPFAGAATCRQCHQAIYDSAIASAHFNASAAATFGNTLGNFNAGFNRFVFTKDTLVQMEKRDSGMYQVLYVKGKENAAYRFDIVFGIRNAQTTLYWKDNDTYELPVSYYSAVHSWATSPGYSASHPDFTRFIGRDCFECHSSNMQSDLNASTKGITETLVKGSAVYGIDCERCHGPAAGHVYYQLKHPEDKLAKHIPLIKGMSPQQRLDMCAVCHSGNDKMKLESRFKFRPGDSLSNFFADLQGKARENEFDVHGNQMMLLRESKCFTGSKIMTCSTCHDPHKNANEGVAVYSQKCMSCHSEANHNFCPMASTLGPQIKSNCIDCHMPKQPSEAIRYTLAGQSTPSSYLLRTHRIGIFPAGGK